MLDRKHLIRGFNALCRAHESDFFFDGHKGGALISATCFLREAKPEKSVGTLLEKKIDAAWGANKLFAAFPKEAPEPARIERVKGRLQAQCCTLRQAAHNWILTALALRVLHEIPSLATPQRMQGLEALIDKFDTVTELPEDKPIDVPPPSDRGAFASFVMQEFIATTKRFDGRGQGWSGHLCTFARALLDLQRHGHADLLEEGRAVMQAYVRRIRMGPRATDRPRAEKSRKAPSPLTLAYWQRAGINFNLGHALKYPYGFFGVLDALDDEKLRAKASGTFWRISSWRAPPRR